MFPVIKNDPILDIRRDSVLCWWLVLTSTTVGYPWPCDVSDQKFTPHHKTRLPATFNFDPKTHPRIHQSRKLACAQGHVISEHSPWVPTSG